MSGATLDAGRCLRRVHHHRQQRVVAVEPEQVDHTVLTKSRSRLRERGVADGAAGVDPDREVVDDRLVG